jgi:ferrochelatase
MSAPGPCSVVLAAFGGPCGPHDIRPFLRRLFSDRRVLPAPLRWFLPGLLAYRREEKTRARYALLGGRSPVLEVTRAQAGLLQAELDSKEPGLFAVHEAFLHAAPTVRDTAARLAARHHQRILVLPMFPQRTFTGQGAISDQVGRIKVHLVPDFHTEPGFVRFHAERIDRALARAVRKNSLVLFTAHSIPLGHVKKGDRYPEQVAATAEAVISSLAGGPVRHAVAYQSRVRGMRWLGPTLEEAALKLPSELTDLVVVPASFVGEHLETMVDLDREFVPMVRRRHPGLTVHRTPSPTVEPEWISFLADLVRKEAIHA